MSTDGPPPVEGAEPPKWLGRIVNPIMKALLRSPLHQIVSEQLALLAFRGRKTGRAYSVVVGRHEMDGELVVVAGGRWRYNFRGGAPVEVTLGGERRRGYARLVEEKDEVVRLYGTLLGGVGPENARRLGLKVNVDRRPTDEELEVALADRGMVRVELARGAAQRGSEA